MSNRDVSLVLKLRDEATSVFKGFVGMVKGDTDKMGQSFSRLGTLLAGAFSIYSIKSALSAFMDAEVASNRLAVALKTQGQYSKETHDAMLNYAESVQKTTTYTHEAVTKAQALLIAMTGVTGNALKPMTRATLDLATGLGIDVDKAALLIAKTIEGGTGLGRYGIHVKDTTDKMERIGSVTDAIAQKFGGFAEGELNTLSGKMKQLGNMWEDFKETLGEGIAKVVAPIMPAISAILNFVAKAIPTIVAEMKKTWAALFMDAIGFVLSLNKVFPVLSASQVTYLTESYNRGKKIMSDADADMKSIWDDSKNSAEDFGKSIKGAGQAIEDSFPKDSFGALKQDLSEAKKALDSMQPNTAGWDLQVQKVAELEARLKGVNSEMELGIAVAQNKWSLSITKMAVEWDKKWAVMAVAPKKIAMGVEEAGRVIQESMASTMVKVDADLQQMKDTGLLVMNAVMSGLQSTFQGVFSGTLNDARDILKAVLNIVINMVEGLIAAAGAAALAKGVLTFGFSTFSDLPLIAAATVGLELARGFINRLHDGGTVPGGGTYMNAPSSREFPILVRGGETVRTEKQEQEAQARMNGGGGASYVFNFYAPVADKEWVIQSIKRVLHETNSTVDKLLVSKRNELSLAGA